MPITPLICPADCEINLPVVNFAECDPEIKLSQINKVYVAREDAIAFTDASIVTEWADRLSQNNTAPVGSSAAIKDLVRKLTVIGDSPAPSVSEKDISGGRKWNSRTERIINLEIDEATAENYEFARTTECGYLKVKIWFETAGGMLYGGNEGITGRIYLPWILGRGVDEIEKGVGTFKWYTKTSPDRCVSPLAS